MCEFISFFCSVKENKLVCGNPMSHSLAPVHSGMDDWRECEWTKDRLEIRVNKSEDESAYRATILSKAKNRKELCELLNPSKNIGGDIFYFNEKGFHRTDGPAIERANGDKAWYIDGKRHRIDGPAIEYADGNKAWYVEGRRHRTNGPAVERANGSKEWWVEGKLFSYKAGKGKLNC